MEAVVGLSQFFAAYDDLVELDFDGRQSLHMASLDTFCFSLFQFPFSIRAFNELLNM